MRTHKRLVPLHNWHNSGSNSDASGECVYLHILGRHYTRTHTHTLSHTLTGTWVAEKSESTKRPRTVLKSDGSEGGAFVRLRSGCLHFLLPTFLRARARETARGREKKEVGRTAMAGALVCVCLCVCLLGKGMERERNRKLEARREWVGGTCSFGASSRDETLL